MQEADQCRRLRYTGWSRPWRDSLLMGNEEMDPDSGRQRQPQEAVYDEAQTSRARRRILREPNSICEGGRI